MTGETIKYKCPILNDSFRYSRDSAAPSLDVMIQINDSGLSKIICPYHANLECLALKKKDAQDKEEFNDSIKSNKCIVKEGFK
jgi:hypothetical protein